MADLFKDNDDTSSDEDDQLFPNTQPQKNQGAIFPDAT